MSAEEVYRSWAPDDFEGQIECGEDSAFESREALLRKGRAVDSSVEGVADALAEFADSDGGSLVFSVSGGREVKALNRRQMNVLERCVSSVCEDRIAPPLMSRTRRLALSHGRVVHIVVVARSADVDRCRAVT